MSDEGQRADPAEQSATGEASGGGRKGASAVAGEGQSVASPFEQIVDDSAARDEAAEWAREELLAGRLAEDVEADLVATGWDVEDAAGLVEEVRKLTRHERGVVTRDDVVATTTAMYRRGYSGWVTGFPLFASARRLIHAIASIMLTRPVKRPKDD